MPAPLRLQALKPAEDAPASLVARLQNPSAKAVAAEIAVAGFHRGADLDATEDPRPDSPAAIPPNGLRTVRFDPVGPPAAAAPPAQRALELGGDVVAFAPRGERDRRGFDGAGRRWPLDLRPAVVAGEPARFALDRAARSRGQELSFDGGWGALWLLGASVDGDREARLAIGDGERRLFVPDWREPLLRENRWRAGVLGRRFDPGRFCRLPTAWSAMPLLGADGRPRALERGTLFAFRLVLDGAGRVVLPDDAALRWLGATLVRDAGVEASDAYAAPLP